MAHTGRRGPAGNEIRKWGTTKPKPEARAKGNERRQGSHPAREHRLAHRKAATFGSASYFAMPSLSIELRRPSGELRMRCAAGPIVSGSRTTVRFPNAARQRHRHFLARVYFSSLLVSLKQSNSVIFWGGVLGIWLALCPSHAANPPRKL